jgi:glycerol kinase
MKQESQLGIKNLFVDGGATRNQFLMQFQADILDIHIHRPFQSESTAFGAALMAGLSVGIYQDLKDIQNLKIEKESFHPHMTETMRQQHLDGWQAAIEATIQKRPSYMSQDDLKD